MREEGFRPLLNASPHQNIPPGGLPGPGLMVFMTFGKGHPFPVEGLPLRFWSISLADSSCPRKDTCSPLRLAAPSKPGEAAHTIPSAKNALSEFQSQLKDHISIELPLAAATYSVCSSQQLLN